MSDERRTGSLAFLSDCFSHHVRPVGSLKRKLGQARPPKNQSAAAYPSPPMSNPPSPSRPFVTISSGVSFEQQTALAEPSLPAVADLPATLAPLSSSPSQQQAPLPLSGAARPLADAVPSDVSAPSAGPSFCALPSGQSVFAISPAPTSGTGTSASTTTRVGRKAKAHVASACTNCKRAHLSCDAPRPCTRCVTSGKQDSCFDVPHKKRGRPRLREESEFKVEQMLPEQAGQIPMPVTPVRAGPSTTRPFARSRHQRTESLRSLRSQASEGSSGSSIPTPNYPPILQPGWTYQAPGPPSSGLSATLVPTAFLDLDLHFIRANRPFKQILCNGQEVRGRRLDDVAAVVEGENLPALRGRMKSEREVREPAHMPPILQPGEDPIQDVGEDDIERLAAGSFDQTSTWTRAMPGAQRETFPARVRLAKATAYFVVVTLPSFRPVEMLPPQSATSLPPPGFMIPPPRAPFLASQPSDPAAAHHMSYQPHTGPFSGPRQPFPPPTQPFQGRSYPSIQPYPSTQPYAGPPPQRHPQPGTPRLPAAEPAMQITPMTPLTNAPRQQAPLAPAIQLPPLASAAMSQPVVSAPESANTSEPQPPHSDDDEESPRKRRRMDISDVLQQ